MRQPAGLALAGSLVFIAAVASVTAPLWTYSLGLATFGAAHVLWELRYVGQRFGARVPGALLAWLGWWLLVVFALRVGRNLALWGGLATELELVVVGLLTLGPLPWLAAIGGLPVGLGVLGVLAIAAGLLWSPTHTILALAVLHNLTPLGFLAEALRGKERRDALFAGLALFLGVPALIATGLPADAAAALGLYAPEATWLPTGPLSKHLGAYLPGAWHSRPWAAHAFSGVVFAQCMHYLAVLGAFPRLTPPGEPARGWPAPWMGAVALLLCAGFLAGSSVDFSGARSWYGPMAAVHAWVELPLLLLAAGSLAATRSR